MPPPLVVMILFPLKENTPARPNEPGRPAPVGGAQCLGGILHQRDPVPVAQRGEGVVVGGLPVEVDGHQGPGEAAGPGPVVQLLGHQVRVDASSCRTSSRRSTGVAPR